MLWLKGFCEQEVGRKCPNKFCPYLKGGLWFYTAHISLRFMDIYLLFMLFTTQLVYNRGFYTLFKCLFENRIKP